MSGIAGIVSSGTEADPALLMRMLSALAHRGPDGEGQWASGPIALGHRLLAVEPGAPQDKQPAADTLGERRLVWDGRLDNRGELTAALAGDLDRRDVSDADLVLAGYRRWGEDIVGRLVGDFAFALWDGITRTMLCARDALGVRPLYYHHGGRGLLFASEVGALLEDRSVPRRPDDATVVDFLRMRAGEVGATFFEGIRRVPPAHLLRLSGNRLTLHRYWTPDLSRTVRYPRDEDYHEAFRALFGEAVRCRLPASGPAAILLSGGIDSTLVAAMAAAVRDPAPAAPLTAITLVYDGFLREEWHAVERVTAATRMRRHIVSGAPGALLLDMLLASPEPPDQAGFPLLGAFEPPPSDSPSTPRTRRRRRWAWRRDILISTAGSSSSSSPFRPRSSCARATANSSSSARWPTWADRRGRGKIRSSTFRLPTRRRSRARPLASRARCSIRPRGCSGTSTTLRRDG